MYRYKNKSTEDELREVERETKFDTTEVPIDSDFPTAGQQFGQVKIVDDSGTLYFILLAKGKRFRAALTEF